METTLKFDLDQVARDVGLPLAKVQPTVALLDDGNTVPFITRYRKDQTGGLDEEQIRRIQETVARQRALTDRKQRILKSLQAQGKLTDDLSQRILAADTVCRVEDLYLPFKPKKQTLAGLARSRGLEPLAYEVLAADPAATDLEARAAQFVSAEKDLPSTAEVLQGVRHLIAEQFSENLPLRDELRKIVLSTGKLVSTRIEEAAQAEEHAETEDSQSESEAEAPEAKAPEGTAAEPTADATTEPQVEAEPVAALPTLTESPPAVEKIVATAADEAPAQTRPAPAPEPVPVEPLPDVAPAVAVASAPAESPPAPVHSESAPGPAAEPPPAEAPPAQTPAAESSTAPSAPEPAPPPPVPPAVRAAQKPGPLQSVLALRQIAAQTRKEAKRRKREKKIESFKDFFKYQEPLAKIPPHRLLAINRGERSKILRVRIEADFEALNKKAEERLVLASHPHAEFLRGCVRDALTRLIVPSLDREIRRELTEKTEWHAVHVFARNLRKLLLQPPVRSRRVLAIDPGFRSGCKLAALDEFGDVLGHTVIHVIGKEDIVRRGRQQVVEMVQLYHIPVIAIGNGTGCRETEHLIADILANELQQHDVQYVIVNEAGASVYSTSSLGREELPKFDPVLRSAISIGRRLQDPLSELVKIPPSNIGVGLYQHDVKAKHLEESLDGVVESCVNFVGVDVNSASPSLLRYVSGLNQLTARRLYEYRQRHGPFRNREQFRNVPGFGEATFIQAAGFLKISGGDNPLDATWIHPESYEVAQRVLAKLGGSVSDLVACAPGGATPLPEKAKPFTHFGVGVATAPPVQTPPAVEPPPPVEAPPGTEPLPAEPAATCELAAEAASPLAPEPAAEMPTVGEPAGIEPAAAEPAAAEPAPVEPLPVSVSAEVVVPTPPAVTWAAQADARTLAQELGIGELLLTDLLKSLTRPGRDPREDLPPPAFRREIMKLDDLQPGMELTGTVLNVVDFGAFVDIGLPDSGLIHISRLADRFVRDPHEIVSVGDMLTVWVVDVDRTRRRVSLTAIKPGTETPREQRRSKPQGAPQPPAPRPEGQQRGERPRGERRRTGSPPQKRQGSGKGKFQRPGSPPPKPKPVRPITKAMVEGKEPMRSFSDLLQFYEKKSDDVGPTPPQNAGQK